MSILEKIESLDFKATKSDKLLIEYIKGNLEEIAYKSISEIAKESNLGKATITRFARKIGFSSLQEFKVTLAQEIVYNRKNRKVISGKIPSNERACESAKRILGSNIDILTNTIGIINDDDIERCADLIINARRIYFFGIGYCGPIAHDTNYKFMRIGLNCSYFDSTNDMIRMISIMEEGDLIIAISHLGETEEVVKPVRVAKENGVNIISITENKDSTLKDLSDVHIGYLSGETVFETGSISSKLAQIFMMDLVYTQVVKMKFIDELELNQKTMNVVELM